MTRAIPFFVIVLMLQGVMTSAAPIDTVTLTVREGIPLPNAVGGQAGGLVGGHVVSAGGTSWSGTPLKKHWHRECFVLQDDGWKNGPALPAPRADMAFASDSTGLYLAGGAEDGHETNEVLVLSDIQTDSIWRHLTPLPKSVQGATAVCLDHTLYVACGTMQGEPLNQLWSLDLSGKDATWKTCAMLPGPGRSHCGFVMLDKNLYLLGGFSLPKGGKITIFDDAYRYDPRTNAWQRLDHIRLAGYAWAASALDDRHVILTGRVRAVDDIRPEVEVLDVIDGRVRTLGQLMGPTCCAPAVQTGATTWCVFGGEPNTQRNRTATVNLLTLTTDGAIR